MITLIDRNMRIVVAVCICLLIFQISSAQVRLPRLIRDSMILQRDVKIKIWGWASAGEKLTIKFNGKKLKAIADKDGKWLAWLSPMKAGGPYMMNIDASNHISIKDILIGDVWLCSGQSNMVHQMILHKERYENDIGTANYPDIRQFWIPTLTDLQTPQDDLPTVPPLAGWKSANPEDVL